MKTVRRVFIYLKRYPLLAIATLTCAIAGTLMVIVPPAATKYILDNVINGRHPDVCSRCRLRLDRNVSICGLNQNKSMLHIIEYIVVGFIIGLIARAIMPGAQHLGFIMTTLLGIGGSIVGGFIGRLFSKPEPGSAFHPAGFILSIIGAIILLFIWIKLMA